MCDVPSIIIIIIIIFIIIITFTQGIYDHIPERNHVSGVQSVTAILWLQYMVATYSVTSHDKHFEVLRHHHRRRR